MPASYAPLRYPGGKAKLGAFLSSVLQRNGLTEGVYAEPYAGGAGAALYLLFRGCSSQVHLNDIDPGVTSFWRALLTHNETFAQRIETVPLDLNQWRLQKETAQSAGPGFDLGFAFFYLNRTNRSGILNGGVIGGSSQAGRWKIDARFNRATLAGRVRSIGRMKNKIAISGLDAKEFLRERAQTTVRQLIYLDPPYFTKGRDLYTNFYTPRDHEAIAIELGSVDRPWLLTYDDCPEVRQLYSSYPHCRE